MPDFGSTLAKSVYVASEPKPVMTILFPPRILRHPVREFVVAKGVTPCFLHPRQVADVDAYEAMTTHRGLYPVSARDRGHAARAVAEIIDELRVRIGTRQVGNAVKAAARRYNEHSSSVFEQSWFCSVLRHCAREARRARQDDRFDELKIRQAPNLDDMARLGPCPAWLARESSTC